MQSQQKYIHSNILCTLCEIENEDQQHILQCSVILSKYKSDEVAQSIVKYNDIFSDNVHKQKEVSALFLKHFEIRKKLNEDKTNQEDPSSARVELELSNTLHLCTNI